MSTHAKSNQLFRKVKGVIPYASQTFSKSYYQFVKGYAPLFLTRGKGAYVWDVDGHKYLDFVNGLLSISLGYQNHAVDRAIQAQLKKGINFSLATTLEYELAQLLIKYIPCAEMVRFGKNGSDVTTGAIRLARAITGRDHIITCGYHGWHDWSIGTTSRNLGVPEVVRKLTHTFKYNDLNSLKKIFKRYKDKIAAVIMEPMNYVEPEKNFLSEVKRITHQNGSFLIFDEVVTGFRFSLGGAQKYFGVTPDLATFGKSMANGMPISALVGKKKYMNRINDIFYSFTFGGECLSLAAAIATIKEMAQKKVIAHCWRLGKCLEAGTNKLLKQYKLDSLISLGGKPCWQVMIIKDTSKFTSFEIKSYLQQELLDRGFLWYGQHNLSFSHTTSDIKKLLAAYADLFPKLKGLIESGQLKKHLKGAPISNIFKVR